MPKSSRYTRRGFLEMLAGSSVATAAAPYVAWLPAGATSTSHKPGFAYVASSADGAHSIHVFSPGRTRWSHIQSIPAEAPAALALSPDHRVLFVANGTRHFENRPAASVESYRIDPASGRIALISRQSLSLSAIEPRHLAVSPDGRYLAVAVTGGGSYNLLPIASDGSLGSVSMLRKEIGFGPHPELQTASHPGQLAFDDRGHLLTTDLGADRVSSFRPDTDTLHVVARQPSQPGSGPSALALHPVSGLLFVGNALDGTIRTHRYSAQTGSLDEGISIDAVPSHGGRLTSLTLLPAGDYLFSSWTSDSATGVSTWHPDTDRGLLHLADQVTLRGSLTSLIAAPDGKTLLALNESEGTIVPISLAPLGALSVQTPIASVAHPTAIVLTHL